MTSSAKKLIDDALTLPPEERQAIAEALMESLVEASVEMSPAWNAELASRIAEIDRGEVEAIPWDDVEQRVRSSLKR